MSDNQRTEDLSQYARIMASISDTPGVVSKLTQIADRLDEQQDRIKRLEDIIEKASKHFRSAGPNAFTAREMADVLKEAKP
jgi:hypothetical protein